MLGNGAGILSDGALAKIRVSNSMIVDNNVGLSSVAPGKIVSFRNNKNAGNTTNGAPTSTEPVK